MICRNMNIMQDPHLFVISEVLNEKLNKILRALDIEMSTNVKQYEDHYSFEFFTADLECSSIISINGKGVDEKKYLPELFEFATEIICKY